MNMKDENICQLPISSVANKANDSGSPLCLSRPDDAQSELDAFHQLALGVSRQMLRLPFLDRTGDATVVFDGNDESFDIESIQLSLDNGKLVLRVYSDTSAVQKHIKPHSLRNRDPKTGHLMSVEDDDEETKDEDVMVKVHRHDGSNSTDPVAVERKAKVGYEVSGA